MQRFCELLQREPHCFERDCFSPGHITASAWVVDNSHRKILLTHHRKLDRWLQLGGHTDGSENTLQSAKREAIEESGLKSVEACSEHIFDLDIHAIPRRGDEPDHLHFDIRYAFVCTGEQNVIVSEESHALAWVDLPDLSSFTSEPSMLRMAAKWDQLREPFPNHSFSRQ